jgi:DNA-binding MarR family transcriptional regulator
MPIVMNELEHLLDEVRLLWHASVQSGERLHAQEPVTLGMRAVLEFLLAHGPATVPLVARSRRVSRQHIQGLVNSLLELDLVALGANPAHRRSGLVRLTPQGQQVIDRMKRRERRVFDRIDLNRSEIDLERACRTLKTVREALEEATA